MWDAMQNASYNRKVTGGSLSCLLDQWGKAMQREIGDWTGCGGRLKLFLRGGNMTLRCKLSFGYCAPNNSLRTAYTVGVGVQAWHCQCLICIRIMLAGDCRMLSLHLCRTEGSLCQCIDVYFPFQLIAIACFQISREIQSRCITRISDNKAHMRHPDPTWIKFKDSEE